MIWVFFSITPKNIKKKKKKGSQDLSSDHVHSFFLLNWSCPLMQIYGHIGHIQLSKAYILKEMKESLCSSWTHCWTFSRMKRILYVPCNDLSKPLFLSHVTSPIFKFDWCIEIIFFFFHISSFKNICFISQFLLNPLLLIFWVLLPCMLFLFIF